MAFQYRRAPLVDAEARALVRAARTNRTRFYYEMLLSSGLRISELLRLTPNDFDRAHGRIRVLGKGNKFRTLPVPRELRDRLDTYLNTLARRPAPTSRTIQRKMRVDARRAGITRPCTPHVLRHTFAVRALQHGISLAALKHLLGHAYLATTEHYLNLSPEAVIAEFERKWRPNGRVAN